MLDCPVCGQRVDPANARTSVFDGVTYYLRCAHCKERFDADPARYVINGPPSTHGGGCGHEEHAGCGHSEHGASNAQPAHGSAPR